jgi:hypothetical protein
MVAEWSVECGPNDPVLVVPWSAGPEAASPTLGPHFIDLRQNPYDLDQIPETDQHPALLQSLRALNANRSPVFTAKCDAWIMDQEELAALHLLLECEETDLTHGFTSYIDMIWRERSLFVSSHQHEQLLHRLVRHAEPLDLPHAALDCVLRPALVDLTGPQEGFALTLYVKALGADAADAYRNWGEALAAVVTLVRSKDLSFS